MKKIGIIGIGNPLRKDDGIGILLLQKLKKNKEKLPENIELIDAGTVGMNILHIISNYDEVIFIDAINLKKKTGETKFFKYQEIKKQNNMICLNTHNFDIRKIIEISKKINKKPSKIYFFGIQPADIGYGNKITQELNTKIEIIFSKLLKKIKEF